MNASSDDQIKKSLEHFFELNSRLMGAGADIYSRGMSEMLKMMRTNTLMFNRVLQHGVGPTLQSLMEMNQDVARPFLETMTGKKDPEQLVEEIGQRVRSGGKYNKLITTLGRELFGSATFEGETVLAQNDFLTLSYLPPVGQARTDVGPLFHAGGFLPYSDGIFRILPEANLFQPFLDAGIPVYAMELKGDKDQLPAGLGALTLEGVIEAIDQMTEVAFEHAGGRKLVLEGYCGLGMPALCYAAAMPRQADRKLKVVFTMVAPVDGRECTLIGELAANIPEQLIWTQFTLGELFGQYVPGDVLRMGMDLPIGSFFPKTPFGRFATGWKNKEYAEIHGVDQLNPLQRREMAGSYWISPENCRRYPIPSDLVRFSSRLWRDGVNDDLAIPYSYQGQQLNFHTIMEQTEIQLAGFYGGKDLVILPQTGDVLARNMGSRYTHVVHPKVGHISYILSAEIWDPKHRYAVDPNPIEVIKELYAR